MKKHWLACLLSGLMLAVVVVQGAGWNPAPAMIDAALIGRWSLTIVLALVGVATWVHKRS